MSDGFRSSDWALDAEADELTDDFLYHFYQGGELLSQGRLSEAAEALEQAAQIKPDNARCQNLLGLVAFKQGAFERSIGIYRDLVGRYPEDAILRINLATVYLKAGDLEQAANQLNQALQIDPGNRKIHRTMAVVLVRQGHTDRARQHLEQAGVEDMGRWLSMLEEEQDSPGTGDADTPVAPAAERPVQTVAELAGSQEPDAGLGDAPAAVVAPAEPAAHTTGPFCIDGDCLEIRPRPRAYTRMDGLVWMEGDLSFSAVRKRFGGQPTKYPFDQGNRAMVRVEGEGLLRIQGRPGQFQLIRHEQRPGYYLEEQVFAFGDTEGWENGRLPFEQEDHLPIFHLRGTAELVLACPGPLRTKTIEEGEGRFLLDVRRLVGWSGNLLPRLVRLDRPLPGGLWIELSGSGEVIYLGGGTESGPG